MIISAPGKLFIAGEWAILKAGNPGIVAAINRKAYVNIRKSKDDKIHIKIRDYNIKDLAAEFREGKLEFKKKLSNEKQEKLAFLKSAIEIALSCLQKRRPFQIESTSQEMTFGRGRQRKELGLGSSAAIVAATVAGILKFHGVNIKRKKIKDKIYKISTIAHYFSQGKVGSGFDVAASTFGGLFLYKRFNPTWLQKQIQQKKSIKEVVELSWPGFYYKRLKIPRDFSLVVGWTGKAASTSFMVQKLYKWREQNKKFCKKLFSQIGNLVRNLIKAWREEDKKKIIKLLRKNEDLLRKLGKKSKINIEDKNLWQMSKIANRYSAAGKISGAGGGDCGIAIAFDKKNSEKIKRIWQKNKIYIIDTNISLEGIREER